MDNSYRVAVASKTGEDVDQHFGRASQFYIYEIEEEERMDLLEVRRVAPACGGGTHDDEHLKTNVLKLTDCRCLIASRIGPGALRALTQYGIEGYELPGRIDEAMDRMVRYRKVQALFS